MVVHIFYVRLLKYEIQISRNSEYLHNMLMANTVMVVLFKKSYPCL